MEMYPHHSYLYISMSVWLGMYLFFVIERFLKMFMDAKARRRGEEIGRHGHGHGAAPTGGDGELEKTLMNGVESLTSLATVEKEEEGVEGEVEVEGCLSQDPGRLYTDSRSAIRASFGHQDKPHPNSR